MTTIIFEIRGNAVAKGRPRTTKKGITYTPAKTRKYEDYVREVASRYAPKELLKGPLRMELHFFFQRPKTIKKVHYVKKGDIDNLVKAIMDALQPRKRGKNSEDALKGAIYESDAQIVSLYATKEYSRTPRVEVKIKEIEEEEANLRLREL